MRACLQAALCSGNDGIDGRTFPRSHAEKDAKRESVKFTLPMLSLHPKQCETPPARQLMFLCWHGDGRSVCARRVHPFLPERAQAQVDGAGVGSASSHGASVPKCQPHRMLWGGRPPWLDFRCTVKEFKLELPRSWLPPARPGTHPRAARPLTRPGGKMAGVLEWVGWGGGRGRLQAPPPGEATAGTHSLGETEADLIGDARATGARPAYRPVRPVQSLVASAMCSRFRPGGPCPAPRTSRNKHISGARAGACSPGPPDTSAPLFARLLPTA